MTVAVDLCLYSAARNREHDCATCLATISEGSDVWCFLNRVQPFCSSECARSWARSRRYVVSTRRFEL